MSPEDNMMIKAIRESTLNREPRLGDNRCIIHVHTHKHMRIYTVQLVPKLRRRCVLCTLYTYHTQAYTNVHTQTHTHKCTALTPQ